MNGRYYRNDHTLFGRLADQAHDQAYAIYVERLKTERADQVYFYDIFNQLYAELIVKECTDLFPVQFTDEQYQRRIDKTILKHFGIYP